MPLKWTARVNIMDEKILEAEAKSLEEARKKILNQLPDDLDIISEDVISDGQPKTKKGVAETLEAAFKKASENLPSDSTILDKKVISNPEEQTFNIDEFDENAAKSKAIGQITDSQTFRGISLETMGKKGFLGIGKKPNTYKIAIWQNAVVEVRYAQKAVVHVKLGKKPYEFKNKRYYSNRSLSDLEGVILLAPVGEAQEIASSKVFIGVIEDTAGTWIYRILKQCTIFSIGHSRTASLFRMAAAGSPDAMQEIIETGISACREKTNGIFPTDPVKDHFYKVGAMHENDKTGSSFIFLAVYKS